MRSSRAENRGGFFPVKSVLRFASTAYALMGENRERVQSRYCPASCHSTRHHSLPLEIAVLNKNNTLGARASEPTEEGFLVIKDQHDHWTRTNPPPVIVRTHPLRRHSYVDNTRFRVINRSPDNHCTLWLFDFERCRRSFFSQAPILTTAHPHSSPRSLSHGYFHKTQPH